MSVIASTDASPDWRPRRWLLLAPVVLLIVFVGGVVGAQLVPDDPIFDALSVAADAGELGPDVVPDGIGGLQDKYTECLALGAQLGAPADRTLIARSLYSAQLGESAWQEDECEKTIAAVRAHEAGNDVTGWSYARYWHGYTPLTRPVLALGGVAALRALVTLLFVLALAVAVLGLVTRLGWAVTAALLLPVLGSTNVLSTPALALTHALSWCVIFAGTGAVALVTGRWGWRAAIAAAALGSAVFNYIDLLTTPAAPWAWWTFAAAATVTVSGAPRRETFRTLLAVGAAWPAAYALTWVTKWLLVVVALDHDFLGQVGEVAQYRISGSAERVSRWWGASTLDNVAYWWQTVATSHLVLPGAVLVVGVCLRRLLRRDAATGAFTTFLILSLPSLLVVAWYEVLRNHSQIHDLFTYRSVPVAVGVVVAAAIVAVRRPDEEAPRVPGRAR